MSAPPRDRLRPRALRDVAPDEEAACVLCGAALEAPWDECCAACRASELWAIHQPALRAALRQRDAVLVMAMARSAWAAWCEQEAAVNDARAAEQAAGQAQRAVDDIHRAILVARQYRYYDKARLHTPALDAARAVRRAAQKEAAAAWDRVYDARAWVADCLCDYYVVTLELPDDYRALCKAVLARRQAVDVAEEGTEP